MREEYDLKQLTIKRRGSLSELTGEKPVEGKVRVTIARCKQKHLLELFGKLEWDADYDYKAGRSRK